MADRPRLTQLPGNHSSQSYHPAVSLGTDSENIVLLNKTGATIKVTGVYYTPDTAVTGDDTDNYTLAVQNKGAAGTGTTAVASLELATDVDMTANVAKAITVSTTAANLLVSDGHALTLKKTEANSGLALPEGQVTITYQFV